MGAAAATAVLPPPTATSIVVLEEACATAKVRAARLYSFSRVERRRARREEARGGGGAAAAARASLSGGVSSPDPNRSLAVVSGRAERGVVSSTHFNPNTSAAMEAMVAARYNIISPLYRGGGRGAGGADGYRKGDRSKQPVSYHNQDATTNNNNNLADATTNNNLQHQPYNEREPKSPRGGGGGGAMMAGAPLGRNGSIRFASLSEVDGGNGTAAGTHATSEEGHHHQQQQRRNPSPLSIRSTPIGNANPTSSSFSRRPSLANVTSFRKGGTKMPQHGDDGMTGHHTFHHAFQYKRSVFTNRGGAANVVGLGGGGAAAAAAASRIKIRAVAAALDLVRVATSVLYLTSAGTAAGPDDANSGDGYVVAPLLKQQRFVPLVGSGKTTVANVSAMLAADGGAAMVSTGAVYSQQARGSTNTTRVGHVLPTAVLNSARNANTTSGVPSRVIAAVTTTPSSDSLYSRWLRQHVGSQSEALRALLPSLNAALLVGSGRGYGPNTAIRMRHEPSAVGRWRHTKQNNASEAAGGGLRAAPVPSNSRQQTAARVPLKTPTVVDAPAHSASIAVLLKQLDSMREQLAAASVERDELERTITKYREREDEWVQARTNHALELNMLQTTVVIPLRAEILELTHTKEALTDSLAAAEKTIKALQSDAAAMAEIIKRQSEMMAELNVEAAKGSSGGGGGSPNSARFATAAAAAASALNRSGSSSSLYHSQQSQQQQLRIAEGGGYDVVVSVADGSTAPPPPHETHASAPQSSSSPPLSSTAAAAQHAQRVADILTLSSRQAGEQQQQRQQEEGGGRDSSLLGKSRALGMSPSPLRAGSPYVSLSSPLHTSGHNGTAAAPVERQHARREQALQMAAAQPPPKKLVGFPHATVAVTAAPRQPPQQWNRAAASSLGGADSDFSPMSSPRRGDSSAVVGRRGTEGKGEEDYEERGSPHAERPAVQALHDRAAKLIAQQKAMAADAARRRDTAAGGDKSLAVSRQPQPTARPAPATVIVFDSEDEADADF